jgi:hypothetical protein
MKFEEFNSQMQRLITNFGRTAYSQERSTLIWRETQAIEGPLFERIVDRLIGECRQAPLLPEIRDAVGREKSRLWEREKTSHHAQSAQVIPLVRCRMCEDTGVIRALAKGESFGFYAFKCCCEKAKSDPRRFPEWLSADPARFERYE